MHAGKKDDDEHHHSSTVGTGTITYVQCYLQPCFNKKIQLDTGSTRATVSDQTQSTKKPRFNQSLDSTVPTWIWKIFLTRRWYAESVGYRIYLPQLLSKKSSKAIAISVFAAMGVFSPFMMQARGKPWLVWHYGIAPRVSIAIFRYCIF